MAYIRLHDLHAQFGEEEIDQIADVNKTGTPDPVTVGRAIKNADAEIDAALSGRYRLPLSPVPRLVRRLSGDLARWFLYGTAPTKEVESRAKLARDLLRALANGELRLEGALAGSSFARLDKSRPRMRWSGRDRRR
ncbi:MAG: DUF1320 domain-containing protein [Azoarcus sp.]|jgi:phage gp36-like protein|nr:DUF1320 domain-containing protein [Azoarcus sp.]